MGKIILFDGKCNFCNQSVQFIIKRDTKRHFKFVSLQSDVGKSLLKRFNTPEDLDSVILVDDNNCYVKSSAVLRVCRYLRGPWKLAYLLSIVPRPVRDFVYGVFAKNRYKWFGRKESCMLPSLKDRERFLYRIFSKIMLLFNLAVEINCDIDWDGPPFGKTLRFLPARDKPPREKTTRL